MRRCPASGGTPPRTSLRGRKIRAPIYPATRDQWNFDRKVGEYALYEYASPGKLPRVLFALEAKDHEWAGNIELGEVVLRKRYADAIQLGNGEQFGYSELVVSLRELEEVVCSHGRSSERPPRKSKSREKLIGASSTRRILANDVYRKAAGVWIQQMKGTLR